MLASSDPTVGHCTSIALRMMFLRQHVKQKTKGSKDSEPAEISVGTLRDVLHGSRDHHLDDLLRAPVASFCDDIVTPYIVERNLPLIVLCEAFGDDPDSEARTRFPREVMISLPETFQMRWENNRTLKVHFADLKRAAKLVDSVTFFASGLFVYSVSFIFDMPDVSLNVLDPKLMLVLSAIAARPAGDIVHDSVRFRLNDDKDELPLIEFLQARLSRLSKLADESKLSRNVFSLLKKDEAVKALRECGDSNATAKSAGVDALRTSLLNLFPENSHFDGRTLVDIEVIGCSRHDKVLEYARLSEARQAKLDDFSKSLAGLTQNVLDYEEQDEEEIYDSLAGGLKIGNDITFVSKDVAVKFCKSSRVTSEMRCVVGGSPYWMLVQLVMGHNEALLAGLGADIDEQGPGEGGVIGQLLPSKDPHDIEGTRERLNQALKRKIRLAHYIPNLFRYPTEKNLYRFYSKMRGLKLRQKYLVSSEAAWENAVRETSSVTEEQTGHTFNGVLIALGVIQLGGVLAAIAAIDDNRFWYFGTHVFNAGADIHALVDLWNGFGHSYNGGRPDDFSAVWALFVAGVLIFLGSVSLMVAVWPRVRQKLNQWWARMARLPVRRTRPRRPS